MTNKIQYRGNQGSNTPNTGRLPSPFIWATCPFEEISLGTIDGVCLWDDFTEPAFTVPTTEGNFGRYKAFTSTGGTLKPATPAWGGILTLGSDGDDEGASIATVGLPYQISRSHGKFWFEARVKVSSIADTIADVFIGMLEQATLSATVPITATAGALADANFVGFHRLGTDGDKIDFVYKANGVTQVTVEADAVTLVADTYVKLGMIYNPDDFRLTFYANGVAIDSVVVASAAGTDFPNDVPLGLAMAVLNAAAVTSVITIDWWKAAQLAA